MDRKTQIIQTAAKLFREKGYKSVTMRDLADELGIKAASLYNHIESKQEILVIIIMDIAKNFTEHINQIFPINELSSIQKLRQVIRMHIDLSIDKTDALACMNNEWFYLEDSYKSSFLNMRNDYENKFRKIILKGMQKEEIAQYDPEIIVFSLLSTLRTLYLWYTKNKDYDRQTLEEDVTKILLSGVNSPS